MRPAVIARGATQVPAATRFPEGCRFRERCRFAVAECLKQPPMVSLGNGHEVACWKHEEVAAASGAVLA